MDTVAGCTVGCEPHAEMTDARTATLASLRIIWADWDIIRLHFPVTGLSAYYMAPKACMNCIAKSFCWTSMCVIVCTACNAPASESPRDDIPLAYAVNYVVQPHPAQGTLDVALQVSQSQHLLRELRFAQQAQLSVRRADGELRTENGDVVWQVPESGGTLRWTVAAASRRNDNGYDAWLGENWGLLRAEDIVPRAATRTLRGAFSETSMQFRLPSGWSVVTAYAETNGKFLIDKQHRRFAQPDGWIVMGHIGTRRETIAGVRVAVAGPVDHGVRRMDMLALLSWTLPELARVLPELPPRLAVVSAGDPMWRGGLSAPQSLFIHADRPLISENSTSTLLHEVMHSALRIKTRAGYDWIVEGLAEYYSLQLLRRSGGISRSRYEAALRDQADWSKSATKLCRASSTGATTALAVTLFAALDAEIRDATKRKASLDDVLRQLQESGQGIDVQLLRQSLQQLGVGKSKVLDNKNLPGCTRPAPGKRDPD